MARRTPMALKSGEGNKEKVTDQGNTTVFLLRLISAGKCGGQLGKAHIHGPEKCRGARKQESSCKASNMTVLLLQYADS